MNKNLIVIFIFSFLLSSGLSFADTCPRCNGRGYIVMNPNNTAGFGLQPVYSQCPICGATININGGPKHTHQCPRCNGSGHVEHYNSSSHSSSNGGFTITDRTSAEAYIAVHGPKLSIDEQRILQRFRQSSDSNVPNFERWYGKLVGQYISWRDNLDIYCSYRTCSSEAALQNIVNATNAFYNELNSIHFSVPDEMLPVVQSLGRQLDATWRELLERLKYAIKVNDSQRQLEFYQLHPELLPQGETINIYVGG